MTEPADSNATLSPDALRHHETRWRFLGAGSVVATIASASLLWKAGLDIKRGRFDKASRRGALGSLTFLCGLLLLIAAESERHQSERLRRRFAPRLVPPPNL